MRPIRVDADGIAHAVGPTKSLRDQKQTGWYTSCTSHYLRASDMLELPLDAPKAEQVTCMLCLALGR